MIIREIHRTCGDRHCNIVEHLTIVERRVKGHVGHDMGPVSSTEQLREWLDSGDVFGRNQ